MHNLRGTPHHFVPMHWPCSSTAGQQQQEHRHERAQASMRLHHSKPTGISDESYCLPDLSVSCMHTEEVDTLQGQLSGHEASAAGTHTKAMHAALRAHELNIASNLVAMAAVEARSWETVCFLPRLSYANFLDEH